MRTQPKVLSPINECSGRRMDCRKHGSYHATQELDCSRASVVQASVAESPIRGVGSSYKSEYDSLVSRRTRKLFPCHAGRKVVDSKWLFKLKRDADRQIAKYPARYITGFQSRAWCGLSRDLRSHSEGELYHDVARTCSSQQLGGEAT
jgi:hypothetical protein